MTTLQQPADDARTVDPLGDLDELEAEGGRHNRAKVGTARPTTLLYTYGPGAVIDLPQFTVMPTGLDDWERIWKRYGPKPPQVYAPRLRQAVADILRSRDIQLRPYPHRKKRFTFSSEGDELGVPSRVFPQWLRCTGCDMLARLPKFEYTNTNPYRTDQARFEHVNCTGRPGGRKHKPTRRPAVPARYLLACARGHLDEFPYDQWVHQWQPCPAVEHPALRMVDYVAGRGAAATIRCESCGNTRSMKEAQGEIGRTRLPKCRGRHPHLDDFESCGAESHLMLVGASNLWFAATESVIVMPESPEEQLGNIGAEIRVALGDLLGEYAGDLKTLRHMLKLDGRVDVTNLSDDELARAVASALAPPESEDEQERRRREWDPVDLLVPEWQYLQKDVLGPLHPDPASGLVLSKRDRDPRLPGRITRVLAVDRLRKVNALFGFTRIDDFDRVGDVEARLAPLARAKGPAWTVATEDIGEGIFLQLDESAVAAWEKKVAGDPLWRAHRAAHRRNFDNRFSETAQDVDPDTRLKPPRYWVVHTLAHVLIRELAMTCGYSAASLSERLYAWPGGNGRPPAAGLLICTTASDSDGTLGGLVRQSEPELLARVVLAALRRATRCSSDPICATRTPQDPEDFLHGAACHCCVMASETSCERANRFLDRRFLLDLPGSTLGFFTDAG